MNVIKTAMGLIFSVALTGAANASYWNLHMSGIDDSMNVYVNNGLVYTCTFGQSCSVNLNPYLASGTNTLELQLSNASAGWTFDYALLKNGKTVLKATCGKFNVKGCLGNQEDQGIVYDVKFSVVN